MGKKKKSFFKFMFKFLFTIVILFAMAFGGVLLFKNFMCTQVVISGGSMENTLLDNQYGLILKRKYANLKRGDVVVINHDNEWIIKRIVGMPNEVITFDLENNICIDGEILEEPYLYNNDKSATKTLDFNQESEIRLGANQYFCLGDHREVSLDSRKLGPFSFSQIEGKLIAIYGVCNDNTCSSKQYFTPIFSF